MVNQLLWFESLLAPKAFGEKVTGSAPEFSTSTGNIELIFPVFFITTIKSPRECQAHDEISLQFQGLTVFFY
jgi:hypothetical protein